MSGDTVDIWRHGEIYIKTPSGHLKRVMGCRVSDDDIRDDGTVEYPPSGECDCEFERTEDNP